MDKIALIFCPLAKQTIYFSAFDSQLIQRYQRLQVDTYTWETYHTLDDIYQWLSDTALKYPSIVELDSIGKSAEGRNIYAIGIKRPGAKGRVLIEGGMHGNEWISTEFVTYLIHQLIHANATKNGNFIHVANLYHWYLVPVVNPDGYEFSQKEVSTVVEKRVSRFYVYKNRLITVHFQER